MTMLITDEQRAQLLANGRRSQENEDFDPPAVVKLFTPHAGATWLLTELDPDDTDRAFGLCDLGQSFPELGFVSLQELAALSGRWDLRIERDLHFSDSRPISVHAREARLAGRIVAYGLRAFLIAQSLNQIDKAYGQNHSILDNCHVRIAFATNDERTAKRISEALGTGTELRAQRNYAGHRLAPWLGHLMVSRQETARPLLTPGEVMQLPPDNAVVMVSGHPPIKAKKLRHYQDRNFMVRVMVSKDLVLRPYQPLFFARGSSQ